MHVILPKLSICGEDISDAKSPIRFDSILSPRCDMLEQDLLPHQGLIVVPLLASLVKGVVGPRLERARTARIAVGMAAKNTNPSLD